jgi:2',3'-cyclic-nucleotide 2'-phosphodiesterase (5'-nucleotidase family)
MITGADYEIDLSQPIGSRVRGLRVNGRDVAPSETYTLALNSYRQEGGGGFESLKGATVMYDQNESVRELLVADLRRRGQIDPAQFAARNWRLTPPLASAKLRVRPRGACWLRILTINDFHARARAEGLQVVRRPDGGRAAAVDATMDSLARCNCHASAGRRLGCRTPARTSLRRTHGRGARPDGHQAAAANHD